VQLDRGRFHEVEVTLGKPMGNLLPVVTGLSPKDQIVIDGALLLNALTRSIT